MSNVKCWACPNPAVVKYVHPDETDFPAPAYCTDCRQKWPGVPGIWRVEVER